MAPKDRPVEPQIRSEFHHLPKRGWWNRGNRDWQIWKWLENDHKQLAGKPSSSTGWRHWRSPLETAHEWTSNDHHWLANGQHGLWIPCHRMLQLQAGMAQGKPEIDPCVPSTDIFFFWCFFFCFFFFWFCLFVCFSHNLEQSFCLDAVIILWCVCCLSFCVFVHNSVHACGKL